MPGGFLLKEGQMGVTGKVQVAKHLVLGANVSKESGVKTHTIWCKILYDHG